MYSMKDIIQRRLEEMEQESPSPSLKSPGTKKAEFQGKGVFHSQSFV